MGDENNKGPLLPVYGAVVLLAALSVITFTRLPFQGSRPAVPAIGEPLEKVRARLWQDPFSAVTNQAKDLGTGQPARNAGRFIPYTTVKGNAASTDILQAQLAQKAKRGKVTVLGIMEPATPYAEDTEMRIRLRYAAISGLRRLKFVPDDPGHMDFLSVQSRHSGGSDVSLSTIMPFEWLAREREDNHAQDSVLLLWINEELFQTEPLARFARLAAYLGLENGNSPRNRGDVKFKVIGPASSTTLLAMLAEKSGDGCRTSRYPAATGIEIYSAMATVDSSLLLKSIGEDLSPKEADRSIEEKLRNRGIAFKRTIGSDSDLAQKLITELRLRGVDCRDASEHIALVAEWDTFYGRSLPEIYKRVLVENGVDRDGVNKRVHNFSYLRGLDGSLPGEKGDREDKGDKEGAKPQAKGNGGENIKAMEQPMGKSQYDYLRRLADKIYRYDQHLQVQNGSIKAFGILGSDFYDKLLVLQALRQRFPDAVFFTTDLDARLLHPDNIKWTKNLVVASNFNLALRDDVQHDVPPFRDNYQTSVFFAILQAFIDDDQLEKEVKDALREPPSPRIFEIGRHMAFDLSPDKGGRVATVHPPQQDAENSRRLLRRVAVIALLLVPFLCISSVAVKNAAKGVLSAPRRLTIVIAVVLAAAIAVFYFGILGNSDQEPFSLFEGVSIWPTEILRLLALVFSAYFLSISGTSLRRNSDGIVREFAFHFDTKTDEPEDRRQVVSPWGNILRIMRRCRDIIRYDWTVPCKEPHFTMDELWVEYVRRDSLRFRFVRLAIIIFFYAAICIALVSIDRPVSPVRGVLSFWLDKGILFASTLSFVLLIFYVFDVTRVCRRFIAIVESRPEWTPESLQRFAVEDVTEKEAPIREWMLVRLIARRTDAIGRLIFYPFIVWFIMFISRINYFDNWQTPIGLAIVISLGAVYAWSCAVILRRSAERARKNAVQRLTTRLASVFSHKEPDEYEVTRISFVLDEVKAIREGAFAPFTQHPVVQALAVPFGGVGGVYLLDFLDKLNF